jgi:type I restriction enzyme S subunit
MSKLDELIAELCPDGVEYVKLSSICDIKRGERVTKSQLIEDGIYPVFSGGVSPMGYFNKFNREENTITIAQYGTAGYVNWIDEKFWANDVCYSLFPKEVINKRYLYFVLVNLQDYIYTLRIDAVPAHLPVDRLGNIKIPLPPLAVQQEIVRILDNFTELTAELTARRKQYEYYRDLLLTFGDEVPRVAIDDLFNIRNGYTPSKSNKEYWENGVIPWFRMEDIRENGRILSNALQYVSINAVKGRPFPANSIIISTSATIGEHALIQTEFLANQRFTILSLKNEYQDVNIKYLFYYCYILGEWCKNNLTLGHFASVDMVAFKKFRIPLPPLKEQERIVAILDRFDALCNDLTSGIPAEIEARQKQYEYYRDKLLSFKEVTS